GTFQLANGESLIIEPAGVNPYPTYTLASSGLAGSFTVVYDCGTPQLEVTWVCSPAVRFTITNNGADMQTDHTYRLLTANGTNVTPARNSFRLLAGESLHIRPPEDYRQTTLTLITDTFDITAREMMDCVEPAISSPA